jgi:hypothetical protein
MEKRPNSPGPTYAYFDVPWRRFKSFEAAATNQSAGGAVWEYLRVRGSKWDHRFPYRLVGGVEVPQGGIYVPRKATRLGLRTRTLPTPGTGRRGFVRSSLPEQPWAPNRGKPDRGEPDRGIGFLMQTSKSELLSRGLWDLFCELRSISVWESADVVGLICLSSDESTVLGLAAYPSTVSWDIQPIRGPSILESVFLQHQRMMDRVMLDVAKSFRLPAHLISGSEVSAPRVS